MELTDAIYHRQAVRSYTSEAVPAGMVRQLIDAAIRAPSAVNQQPWSFAVIQGRSRLERYSVRAKEYMFATLPQGLALHQRSDQLADTSYNVFHHAGTLIVIYAKPAQFCPAEDCCLAAENLMLAAHGMGLGSCPVGFARAWLDLREVKDELRIPVTYKAVMPIVIGWPAQREASTPRAEAEITTWLGEEGEDFEGPLEVLGKSPAPAMSKAPWS